MDWRKLGEKPISEAMMVEFTDIYVSLGHKVFLLDGF